MHTSLTAILLMILFFNRPTNWAVTVTSNELSEASRWVAAKFEGIREAKPAEGYLMVYTKSGSVQKNAVLENGFFVRPEYQRHWPLRIADKEYRRGLHFPSLGKIVVHLPAPGKNFDALVGMDSNFFLSAGGSIIASIAVRGKQIFRSEVLGAPSPGVPVEVDLV